MSLLAAESDREEVDSLRRALMVFTGITTGKLKW
jgi:hypothetical protein